ncbi:hypothetical protein THASP1DRAFT_30834 [Thamnocephalis sphaerospora]|uniref:PDZ domain-containing protein n=1 Tax=Thamnocephalis sphaerospora TaxID=78915 RepID=A0A4P9XN43_9FUNG|nr:hypothetical protein THASP1DRAFT_30834 [Thamnocephalis sphaerospora]|eukprot:RKP07353.1 hypothetical protein THASP1DRAFT_30834 [Thamnocephalis sphaerospora]
MSARRLSKSIQGEPNTEPPVKRLAELNLNPTADALRAHATHEQLSPHFSRTHKPRSKSVNLSSLSFNSPYVLEDPRFSYYPPVGAVAPRSVTSPPPSWEPTLERAIKAIVSIQANHVRSFDTETAGSYTATGFIVDAKEGIILSNRHVVSPAPIVANAILCNYEEVPLHPVYRDPVHDFGFLRFDTSKIKFMDLVEIPLAPSRARVGVEIRVVGNDAGEKLSILAGTLARLDRRAPEYGVGEYNDFNTFYFQAASGTSGGSSGSPVLDINGNAVALNAGGASQSSSSYYLPLDRVKRALDYVRRGEQVPRGTLQVEFVHQPYDEVRRLGLPPLREEMLRHKRPHETGLLVVQQVLPRAPADGILREGDIIISVDGKCAPNFITLADIMDSSVGQMITMVVSRGPEERTVTVPVQDLHSITPDRFVEVGGGVVNELSYQLARGYAQPVGGVYVATSGHMLGSASAWRKSLIISINHKPTPDLDTFIAAVNTLPDGARVPIRFYSLAKAYKERVMIMHVDRHWHNYRMGVRNDHTGLWDMTVLPPPPQSLGYKPATASYPTLEDSLQPAGKLMPCFVAIDFHLPYLVDGMKNTQFYGAGLIIDKARGLVICDRDTIPISAGDILLTFANSLIIPGKLVYLHPVYNYAIVHYDPALLADTLVEEIELVDEPLAQGDDIRMVGIGSDHNMVMKKTSVASVGNIGTRECSPPRWRAVNVEGIKIDDPASCLVGVLCNPDGKVRALWINYSSQNDKGKDVGFMSGLASQHVIPLLEQLRSGKQPCMRAITDVEFWTMRIAAARSIGLSDEWVHRIEASNQHRHMLLYVLNILASDSAAACVLQVGDVVLEINGKVVTRMGDLAVQNNAEATLFRDGKEVRVRLPTTELTGVETTRVIGWAGALVQEPYRAVLEQVKRIPSGVYVSCTLYGAPANTYDLKPGVWITEVDGKPVNSLDSFLAAVSDCEREAHGGYIRLTTVSRAEMTGVLSLRTDPHYWPTFQLLKDNDAACGWRCEYL